MNIKYNLKMSEEEQDFFPPYSIESKHELQKKKRKRITKPKLIFKWDMKID